MSEKCIVHGCANHKDEGVFIGNLCRPCWQMLTSGNVGPTKAFFGAIKSERDSLAARYDDALKRINDLTAEIEALRTELARKA